MSKKLPSVYLDHMAHYSKELVNGARTHTKEQLESDSWFYHGAIRLISIVGEAANKIPKDVQSRYSQLPWKELIGMRNILVHQYENINIDIVWKVITEDLPPIIPEVEKALEAEIKREEESRK